MSAQPVYHYHVHDGAFRAVSHQGQLSCHVATDTQKRACELLKISVRDMQTYGGSGGPRALLKLCRDNPEVVFAEIEHGVYCRREDVGAQDKYILLDMKDEEVYGRELRSAAFGMIGVSRVSGEQNLFGVDYPQAHFIRLTISKAHLNRSAGSDRVMSDNDIISVDMSEVQWARMIASPNTSGVPCTLSRFFEPGTGEFMTPVLPERHAADSQTFKDEVKARAEKAMTGVAEAKARLAELLKGGPLKKGDVQEVLDLLQTANMQMTQNLPYIVERAAETIDDATENAKTEVGAFMDFAMQKLGERALGERVVEALANGGDLRAIGRQVADAVIAPPVLEDKREE